MIGTNGTGELRLGESYEPYGEVLSSTGDVGSSYSYAGEWLDTTGVIFLRARNYNPHVGRFVSRDAWGGDFDSPISLNRWVYANANPVRFTDPSGRCILTGVDTIACLVALAIGVPVVAGVTTAAWNFSLIQGGGLGGSNQNRPECIDWFQVLEAGRSGTFGAAESVVSVPLSIPLGPTYILAALVYHQTPIQVNERLLANFGLDDKYRAALNNKYYVAGRAGGGAAATYVSLATFLNGLPILNWPEEAQLSSNGVLFLNAGNVTIVGGDGTLVYAGTAGIASTLLSMMSNGDKSGGKQIYPGKRSHPNWPQNFQSNVTVVQSDAI